ncbi:hypothetical protein EI555_021440 [Monodon monoceros]|uniref:Uncharacterized protein n=1 Tax=Monodon monoceros TaxID=40151 RepID=A0A4U1FP87_MONMO|nr:hypothetical protein EI555_021440 [Monodon monoceros]
MHSYPKGY